MSTWKPAAVASLFALLTAAPAFADPVINLTAKVVSPVQSGVTQDVKIEVDALMTNLSPGFSFGGVAFDVLFNNLAGSSLVHPSTSTYLWKPNNPIWVDDLGTSHLALGDAGDLGPDHTDLISIVALMQPKADDDAGTGVFGGDANDPRLSLGTTSLFKLGTYTVQWNGVGTATLGFQNVEFVTMNDNTALLVTPAYSQINPPIAPASDFNLTAATLTAVPLPPAAFLALSSLPFALFIAKRQKHLKSAS